jgi:post-segregation antitoxin (ccd killing protein)
MPRLQVYLPEELHALVKARHLPASELLQVAVRAELRRLDLLERGDRYVAELKSQVGAPKATDRTRARTLAGRVAAQARRRAG